MSDDDVELVQRWHAGWNEGGLAAVRDLLHPDIEWEEASEMPGGGTHVGRPAVEAYLQSLVDTVGNFKADVVETAVAGEQVITVLQVGRSVTASGVPFEFTVTHIHEIRDGKLASVRVFFDRDQAFAAAGLSP